MSDFLMKKVYNHLIAILLLSLMLFLQDVEAQSSVQYMRQGDKSFVEADYYTAFFYYNQAKEIDSSETEAWYKMGESSRKFNDYKGAFNL